jgi:hypothetical protein
MSARLFVLGVVAAIMVLTALPPSTPITLMRACFTSSNSSSAMAFHSLPCRLSGGGDHTGVTGR